MNGRIFRMDIPAHQAVQELLPWYAASQLAPEETQRVQQHLQTCAECRQELEWEREMRAQAAVAAASGALPDGVDMERALARLMPALGAQEHATTGDGGVLASAPAQPPAAAPGAVAARQPWWRTAAANQPSWLRWTVAAQWVAIVGLLVFLVRPGDEAPAYRVLGSSVSNGGNMVVVFQPGATERDLRRILQTQGARVVDGPTVTDAYLLHVPTASRDRALQALRAEPAVKLAEPLDSGSPP